MSITWLETSSHNSFPPVEQAFDDGLLAAGGDLSTKRLLSAYRHGIFPWFNKNDPILWWSPDPRMVLFTDHTKISKSLKKTLRNTDIHISMDRAFDQVMLACSAPRSNQPLDPENSSWIHPQMIAAYTSLHQQGFAHSVECWQDNKLIGGLYGVAIGHAFFGESMFSMVRDSSKIALIALCQQLSRWGYPLIDCQVHSDHLASLGAKEISRHDFIKQLNHLCPQAQELTNWQLDKDLSNIL
jgi:leucyl/phenylalanyl-tRNA---protein transferase